MWYVMGFVKRYRLGTLHNQHHFRKSTAFLSKELNNTVWGPKHALWETWRMKKPHLVIMSDEGDLC